jgi:Fe-S oxidoreductase
LQHVMAQCVNCGSCYLECPSNVNIPKLAMEAKAQYARLFGVRYPERITAHVELMAKATHKWSPVIGAAMRIPNVRKLATRMAGLASQRGVLLFDRRTLYQRFPSVLPGNGPRVLYYAGCYAGFIRPGLGVAAVDLLHRMGMQVHLPRQACCGLPQLSKGLATAARRAVQRNLASWHQLLSEVDWIVVTCSSCGYALMQDWSYLLDRHTSEQVRAKTIHISQLIGDHVKRLVAAPLAVRLAYHHPCHLRIQPNSRSSLALLKSMNGVQLEDLQSNCCGIAGSWGMLRDNYELSRTIGAPMLKGLEDSGADFAVTDCPTCQMQMEHLGRLPVRHPVEVVWHAVRAGDPPPGAATN